MSSVLDRIPPAFLTREELDLHQPMGLTIVDDLVPTTMPAPSSQEVVTTHTDPGATLPETDQSATLARWKRRRAK